MGDTAFGNALNLVLSGDSGLYGIVGLSLQVSLAATALASVFGLPLAALMATFRFPGRSAVIAVLNTMMGLPPVVVGLIVYLALSRAGPLGDWGLLFTPSAMVIAQTILITPIVAAIAFRTLEDFDQEYAEQLTAHGLSRRARAAVLMTEARFSLVTAILAGFGRAVAEVGAVMIVGGNIAGVTRVMTTAIALETSKGDLPLALGLGMILIAIALTMNALAALAREAGRRVAGEGPARGDRF